MEIRLLVYMCPQGIGNTSAVDRDGVVAAGGGRHWVLALYHKILIISQERPRVRVANLTHQGPISGGDIPDDGSALEGPRGWNVIWI